jgi:hypothetical protein
MFVKTLRESPFLFGKTVFDQTFINRKEEIDHLWLNLRSGINTILISPRRYGKSSLVKHTAFLNSKNRTVKWCFIDMFTIRNEEDFCQVFSTEIIKATSTKWQDWQKTAANILGSLLPEITVGVNPPVDFKIKFNWQAIKSNKKEILNLPEKIAQKLNLKIIVCIDEFQNINTFSNSESFEKELRSYWQQHKRVSYCLYGSKRTLMAEIFNKKNRAFYRFGDLIMLDKISQKHWIEFIQSKFKQTKKIISKELASYIAEQMKNHPYYVQQYSHYIWELTEKTATQEILDKALRRLLDVNSALFQYEIENLSNTQLALLLAIKKGETNLTSIDTQKRYPIGTPNNITKNIKILEKKDFIERINKQIEFIDPVFELWFQTFFS